MKTDVFRFDWLIDWLIIWLIDYLIRMGSYGSSLLASPSVGRSLLSDAERTASSDRKRLAVVRSQVYGSLWLLAGRQQGGGACFHPAGRLHLAAAAGPSSRLSVQWTIPSAPPRPRLFLSVRYFCWQLWKGPPRFESMSLLIDRQHRFDRIISRNNSGFDWIDDLSVVGEDVCTVGSRGISSGRVCQSVVPQRGLPGDIDPQSFTCQHSLLAWTLLSLRERCPSARVHRWRPPRYQVSTPCLSLSLSLVPFIDCSCLYNRNRNRWWWLQWSNRFYLKVNAQLWNESLLIVFVIKNQ